MPDDAISETSTERVRRWRQANPERARDYNRQYREANREAISETKRRYYDANGDAVRERVRQYREANPEKVRERQRRDNAKVKATVLAHYGTVCACCGTAKKLTIDHVNGNGADHRKQLYGQNAGRGGVQFYRWLIANGFPAEFQTLCLPCNQSKGRGEEMPS